MPKRRPIAVELDATDLKILSILQRDNRTPQRTIGESVHLSAPAVQRRMKRLEKAGVISANICVVDPEAAGSWLTVLVNVDLESERTELVDRAKAAFLTEPAVQQCYYVAGETDFVLVVSVRTMGDYEELTRRLFFDNDNVKRFRTFVAMDRVKVGLAVPLAE